MSGSFPGIDLYGYVRFATTLQPVIDADIVIISYLEDLALSDGQLLIDSTPENGVLRNILVMLDVLQNAHESLGLVSLHWSHSQHADETRRSLLETLARDAEHRQYEVLLFSYNEVRHEMPPGIRLIELPERLRFVGESNEFWYGMDQHPKPALLTLVASQVADALPAAANSWQLP